MSCNFKQQKFLLCQVITDFATLIRTIIRRLWDIAELRNVKFKRSINKKKKGENYECELFPRSDEQRTG